MTKRNLLFFIVSVVLSLALVGCGSEKAAKVENKKTKASNVKSIARKSAKKDAADKKEDAKDTDKKEDNSEANKVNITNKSDAKTTNKVEATSAKNTSQNTSVKNSTPKQSTPAPQPAKNTTPTPQPQPAPAQKPAPHVHSFEPIYDTISYIICNTCGMKNPSYEHGRQHALNGEGYSSSTIWEQVIIGYRCSCGATK